MFLTFYCFSDEFSCGHQCKCYTDVPTRALVADCSNLNLIEIPDNLPNYTDWLIVSQNNISSLNEGITQTSFFPHLTKLDISENSLDNISNAFYVFTCCSSTLSSLDISSNNLTTLPTIFQNISSLKSLRISENPLECNCESMWMKDWLNASGIIEDFENISCTMPGASPRSIPVIEMNPKDMGCPEPESTTTANLWKILGFYSFSLIHHKPFTVHVKLPSHNRSEDIDSSHHLFFQPS